ncbi:hypothetical protein KVH22_21780 [Streptomyces olivaceus]|uniref:hypothetical protein n=1 Tax=Streptomyces olivaceus TaxID=47716 RepID=UPI001CCCE7DF|nr:hypothetical protein [Streptomyces olivaceus]MBZ6258150.1 hypothetical protein [Streptomyces olivaceus]
MTIDALFAMERATEDAPIPAVGDRYVNRTNDSRIATITRVWTSHDGHTAVTYEWIEPTVGKLSNAWPLDLFDDAYRPEAQR